MKFFLDLNNPRERRLLIERIGKLRGWHSIEITKPRKKRSLQQNRFYWPCFVQPFGDWLREDCGNAEYTDEMAHEILKRMFLEQSVQKDDGNVYTFVRSTTDLSTVEFNQYLDQIAAWLVQEIPGFVVPDPEKYRMPIGAEEPEEQEIPL